MERALFIWVTHLFVRRVLSTLWSGNFSFTDRYCSLEVRLIQSFGLRNGPLVESKGAKLGSLRVLALSHTNFTKTGNGG